LTRPGFKFGVIQAVLETNKTVTFAIKRRAELAPEVDDESVEENDGDDDDATVD
jgi:hypothetical protein